MVDYYKELEINRNLSTEEINKKLIELDVLWTKRSNNNQEKARPKLLLISEAQKVFKTDSSRREYDRSLSAELNINNNINNGTNNYQTNYNNYSNNTNYKNNNSYNTTNSINNTYNHSYNSKEKTNNQDTYEYTQNNLETNNTDSKELGCFGKILIFCVWFFVWYKVTEWAFMIGGNVLSVIVFALYLIISIYDVYTDKKKKGGEN